MKKSTRRREPANSSQAIISVSFIPSNMLILLSLHYKHNQNNLIMCIPTNTKLLYDEPSRAPNTRINLIISIKPAMLRFIGWRAASMYFISFIGRHLLWDSEARNSVCVLQGIQNSLRHAWFTPVVRLPPLCKGRKRRCRALSASAWDAQHVRRYVTIFPPA